MDFGLVQIYNNLDIIYMEIHGISIEEFLGTFLDLDSWQWTIVVRTWRKIEVSVDALGF